jgi:hypothetical protein
MGAGISESKEVALDVEQGDFLAFDVDQSSLTWSDLARARDLHKLTHAGDVQLFSSVNTEAAVSCCRGKRCELRVCHMNERRVVSALEIDLRLPFDAVIDNSLEAVAFANWRNGARYAVIEQFFDLVLGCQVDIQAELPPEVV